MRGQYRNYRGGLGGHVRGRGRSTSKTIHTKKTVHYYLFYVVSRKQASDYENTSDFVVSHIKKTLNCGNNVAEALKNMVKSDTDVWKPTLNISFDLDVTI